MLLQSRRYKKNIKFIEGQRNWPLFSPELGIRQPIKKVMAKKKKVKELQPKIKVRLDSRTIITVRDESKLDFWREKYPNLEVIKDL
jgi:hypothetical protein